MRPRAALATLIGLLLWAAAVSAHALTVELSGRATLRPIGARPALGGVRRIVLDDDLVEVTARVTAVSAAEWSAVTEVVLQRRHAPAGAWEDIHTFYRRDPRLTPIVKGPTRLPAPGRVEQPSSTPAAPVSHELARPAFTPPLETSALRATVRRQDGTSVESRLLLVEVRRAPAVLTLLAMGGACAPDPDANTSHTSLAQAQITRDAAACAQKNVPATYLGDLTPMASVNCNDPCNAGCMNFMEHLALRLMHTLALATRFDSIDNPGQRLCHARTNPAGIRNRIVFGKWRNTDEEPVCATPIRFNRLIDDFVREGGQSMILVGQSQGGAKFAGMVRDHWRWGNDLSLELLVLWDATSFDTVKIFPGHPGIASMGVERVGPRPRHTLSFYQYSNLVPFQNGAPLLDPAEQHDLDRCFSHNAIARSQWVHQRTAEAVRRALATVRDRARAGP
jgi:hypothetical protein